MSASANSEGSHAFGPASAATAAPVATPLVAPKRSWGWWLLGILVAVTLLAALMGAVLVNTLDEASREGFQLTVNGQHWPIVALDSERGWAAVLAIGLTLLLLVVVLPVVLLLVAGAVTLSVGLALGLAGVAAVVAVVSGLGAVFL
ncbi:MAG: hypothetical protein Q8M96_04510, partial [Rubrivivax sp.]|nr:hypothetical protein [Rubrivivax sp.]